MAWWIRTFLISLFIISASGSAPLWADFERICGDALGIIVQTAKISRRTEISKQEEYELFKAYQKTPTEALRNQIIETYAPVVAANAAALANKLVSNIDPVDLFLDGQKGLLDAIDAFDLSRNIRFASFAAPRIRGSILDAVRANDWIPRLVRKRNQLLEQARIHLITNGKLEYTDQDLRDVLLTKVLPTLKTPTGSFRTLEEHADAILKTPPAPSTKTLAGPRKFTENNETDHTHIIPDRRTPHPLHEPTRKDLKDFLLKRLSRTEKMIVTLYYYEGINMQEVGKAIGISESRVSQMLSSILARLKAQFGSRPELFTHSDD